MNCDHCGKFVPSEEDYKNYAISVEADSQFDGGEWSTEEHAKVWSTKFCHCENYKD